MFLDDTNIVLNELKSLYSLDEMLLMQILLRIHSLSGWRISLRHLRHKLVERVALGCWLLLLLLLILAITLGLVVAASKKLLALLSITTRIQFGVGVSTSSHVALGASLDRVIDCVLAHGKRIPLSCLQPLVAIWIAAALQATMLHL